MSATYSDAWYELFTASQAPETAREIAFLERWLPYPKHRRVLDVCCGAGRHANELARRGREVLGVDKNERALAAAWADAPPGARFMRLDMLHLDALPTAFGAVTNLWQSFGYFDDVTNAAIVAAMARRLALGGRLVIDLYNRPFFERRLGERRFSKGGIEIVERKSLVDRRMRVELTYGDAGGDAFEWRLYTPEEFAEVAAAAGLRPLLACASYAEAEPPSPDRPRMQLVFELG